MAIVLAPITESDVAEAIAEGRLRLGEVLAWLARAEDLADRDKRAARARLIAAEIAAARLSGGPEASPLCRLLRDTAHALDGGPDA